MFYSSNSILIKKENFGLVEEDCVSPIRDKSQQLKDPDFLLESLNVIFLLPLLKSYLLVFFNLPLDFTF